MSNLVYNANTLYLLLLLIPLLLWYILRFRNQESAFTLSSGQLIKNLPRTRRHIWFHVAFGLRVLALACFVLAFARPQRVDEWQNVTTQGIDIVIAIDVSSSMLALDFKPNRLEAAKDVAMEFVAGRESDRIGLVVFSGESFTQCPVTTDKAMLINFISKIESGIVEDGTAIGLGLANSVNRLKTSKSLSKVIILLTDGENNSGEISPITAAEIAKNFGIRVYTIGIGTKGMAPYPVQTPFGVDYQNVEVKIDEASLKEIAGITGGKYYRATDKQKLANIYKEIETLEKSKIEIEQYSNREELFMYPASAAFLMLLAGLLIHQLIIRKTP